MCGFAGIIGNTIMEDPARNIVGASLHAISHRGPDDGHIVSERGMAMGLVRLSIVDGSGGRQPMVDRGERHVIVFNGEIYNHADLRNELESAGEVFQTRSDTEVLLLGFIRWGEEILPRLQGMFSFAIYDRRERTLFLARDNFGQKPLYYFCGPDWIQFASETKCFYSNPEFKREVDHSSMFAYLRSESLDFDRTFFRGLKKLPAGHFALWRDGVLLKREDYNPQNGFSRTSCAEFSQIKGELERSVELTCRASIPIAFLLSGGLDSSLVLAMAARHLPRQKMEAFHVSTAWQSFDESLYAARAAKYLQVNLIDVRAGDKELSQLVYDLPDLLDEPIGDPGFLVKYLICQQVSKSYKVALTGDGADEIFLGYPLFLAEKGARLFTGTPKRILALLRWFINGIPASCDYMSRDFIIKKFLKGLQFDAWRRSKAWMEPFSENDLEGLLRNNSRAISDDMAASDFSKDLYEEVNHRDLLDKLSYRLQRTYLPDYVLLNSDRASMLNSIELRTPFLNSRLTNLINSLPSTFKMGPCSTKVILKRIAQDYLPADLIHRKKMGFTSPIGHLFKGPLRKHLALVFDEGKIQRQGLFEPKEIQRILADHQMGRVNNSRPLWILLTLQNWLDKNIYR